MTKQNKTKQNKNKTKKQKNVPKFNYAWKLAMIVLIPRRDRIPLTPSIRGWKDPSQETSPSFQNQNFPHIPGHIYRGGFRGGALPLFFAEIGRLTLCGHPLQAKRIHQIVRIHFENCTPLRHPLSPQAPKFCQSLFGRPSFKNPGSTPDLQYLYLLFVVLGSTS